MILGLFSTESFITIARRKNVDTNIDPMKVVATIRNNNDPVAIS